WYPMVRQFGPEPLADLATAAKGSYLDWARVELLPQTSTSPTAAGTPVPAPRQVKSEDTWRFARETDAALVKVCSRKGDPKNFGREFDYEKFLFYRGLGTMDMPLEVRSAGTNQDLRLTLRNRGQQVLHGLFAIWVEDKTIRFAPLKDLAKGDS